MSHVLAKFSSDITINGQKLVGGEYHLVPEGVAHGFSRHLVDIKPFAGDLPLAEGQKPEGAIVSPSSLKDGDGTGPVHQQQLTLKEAVVQPSKEKHSVPHRAHKKGGK